MKQYYYLVYIQYLGFRFHGWQKQPAQKTIHQMIDKTVEFVLGKAEFKTMGSSKTDSKVSANTSAFELFTKEPIDLDWFLANFNSNLPNDIRATLIQEVDKNFNIINTPRLKEYLYLFTFAEKPHPFSASLMAYFKGDLDIELMKKGAKLFEGEHNFVRYCTKPSANTKFNRTINLCQIVENSFYTANFFPKKSFALRIQSYGFLRYQVRLIMAQLVELGKHEIDLKELELSLTGKDKSPFRQIVPGSGLMLNSIIFD